MRPRDSTQSRLGRVLHVLGHATKLDGGKEAKTDEMSTPRAYEICMSCVCARPGLTGRDRV